MFHRQRRRKGGQNAARETKNPSENRGCFVTCSGVPELDDPANGDEYEAPDIERRRDGNQLREVVPKVCVCVCLSVCLCVCVCVCVVCVVCVCV